MGNNVSATMCPRLPGPLIKPHKNRKNFSYYSPQNIFTLPVRQLKTDGKRFTFAVCGLTQRHA